MKIVGVPGSTRETSFNREFLKWIKTVVEPMGASMEVVDITNIPVAMGSRDNIPPVVQELKDLVSKADAIIFSTPQYNYSFTQILKNTIDWVASPDDKNAWAGKKGYVVGVSMDSTGVIKAEEKLKQYMQKLGVDMFTGEAITIDRATESKVFDGSGGLIDKKLEETSKELLRKYVDWVKR